MNSFLRRVVSSAQTSAGSVRPILGSVYSHSTPSRVTQDPDGESADRTASQAMRENTSAGVLSGFEPENLGAVGRHSVPGSAVDHAADHHSQASDDLLRAADRQRAGDSGRLMAASPHPATRVASHGSVDSARDTPPRRAAGNAAHAAAPLSISSRAIGGDVTSAAKTGTTAESIVPLHAADDYTPLIPGAPPPPASRQGALAPMAASPNTAAAMLRADAAERNASAARRAQPAARAADDIQIHIGRIEVTAALPAPPRPAVAPAAARKSPSLDEFLKRRKGRIG
jgi:hypothetical protein